LERQVGIDEEEEESSGEVLETTGEVEVMGEVVF
jgi:hypothetical protein